MVEQGKGIARVDAGAGEAVCGRRGRCLLADESLPGLGRRHRQVVQVLVHPARCDFARQEVLVLQHVVEERNVRSHTFDAELREGTSRAGDRGFKVRQRGMSDHLREQRVEGRGGGVAGIAEAVRAHARTVRRFVHGKFAAGGAHGAIFAQGFHVDARLNGKAARPSHARVVEAKLRKRCPLRQANLRLDDVHTGHFLRDRVLHLQPGIGLDEDERTIANGFCGVDEKLEGAETGIALMARELHGCIDDRVAQFVVESWGWRDFHHLLVPPLHAALALAQMGDVAGRIAKNLHLDVAGAGQKLLHIDVGDAER